MSDQDAPTDPNARIEKAVEIAERYGGSDGANHKMWVIDQMVRALVPDYEAWVKRYETGENGSREWEWDAGIAP